MSIFVSGVRSRLKSFMKYISFLFLLFMTIAANAQRSGEMSVHFDFDKYHLNRTAAELLDSLISSLPANKQNTRIEIYGHCDTRGTEEYNSKLSVKRVKAVEKYLLDKSIPLSSIIKSEGYGEQRPLEDGNTEPDHQVNRRVELLVTVTLEKPVEKPVEKAVAPPVTIPPERTLTETIQDTAIKIGSKITLRNLNFVGGSHYLVRESAPAVQELLKVLQANPKLEIAIEGHICCRPGNEDGINQHTGLANLSEARAKMIYDYLVKSGIAASRLSYKGFGHQFPLYPYPERSMEEAALNRRVEIRIVSK
jgi:outer membrane protein OmpA-like peptidoglycan-associated protein